MARAGGGVLGRVGCQGITAKAPNAAGTLGAILLATLDPTNLTTAPGCCRSQCRQVFPPACCHTNPARGRSWTLGRKQAGQVDSRCLVRCQRRRQPDPAGWTPPVPIAILEDRGKQIPILTRTGGYRTYPERELEMFQTAATSFRMASRLLPADAMHCSRVVRVHGRVG